MFSMSGEHRPRRSRWWRSTALITAWVLLLVNLAAILHRHDERPGGSHHVCSPTGAPVVQSPVTHPIQPPDACPACVWAHATIAVLMTAQPHLDVQPQRQLSLCPRPNQHQQAALEGHSSRAPPFPSA